MEQAPLPVLHESKSEPLSDTSSRKDTPNEAVSRERTGTNWNFSKSQVVAKGGSTTMTRPMISRVRGPSAADSPTLPRNNNYTNPPGNGTSRSNDIDQRGESERLKPEEEVERLLREGRENLRLEQLKEEQEEAERAKLIEQLKNEKERQKSEQMKKVQEDIERKRKELDELMKLQNQNFELEIKQQQEEAEKRRLAAEELRKQEAEKEASNNKWKAILDQATASGIDISQL